MSTPEPQTEPVSFLEGPAFSHRIVGVILFLVAFAAFWPALGQGFVDWDDSLNFAGNPHYKGLKKEHLRWMFTETHVGHWHPLTWVSLALDFKLFGEDGGAYHRTNMLLHAGSTVLVYLIALRLFKLAGSRGAEPLLRSTQLAAVAAALLFAVHPLRVESVAWATERRDVLSGIFLLATVLAYLRRHDAEGEASARMGWALLSFVFFGASLLSKAWGITLPAVLLILDAWPLGRLGPEARRDGGLKGVLLEKVPYGILSVSAAAAAFFAQKAGQSGDTAVVGLDEHGVVQRAVQACYGLAFYVWKSLVPVDLAPLYELERNFDPTRPVYLGAVAVVVGSSVVIVALRKRWPALLAAALAYAVIVSPVLGLVQSGAQLVADRYSYLSCIPWALLIGGVLARFPRPAGLGLALGAVAILFGMTLQQTRVWKDSLSLWEHVVEVQPQSYVAQYNLGNNLMLSGRPQAEALAEAAYRASVASHPGAGNQDARIELGKLVQRNEGAEAALALYLEGLEIAPEAWKLCDVAAARLTSMRRLDEARNIWTRAAEITPDNNYFAYKLGLFELGQRNTKAALEAFAEAVRRSPTEAGPVHAQIGAIHLGARNWKKAEQSFRASLSLDGVTSDVVVGLGESLLAQGKTDMARGIVQQFRMFFPEDARVQALARRVGL